MKTNQFLLSISSLFGLVGCATGANTRDQPQAYVKPAMIMLTADQAEARGFTLGALPAARPPAGIDSTETTAVIVQPGVKAYTVNRTIDPSDRDLLHEEHVIYRREGAPAWRLQPPAAQKILVGPRVTDGREELQPVLSKELGAFLAEQRHATDVNQKAINALFQAVDRLNSAAARSMAPANDSEAATTENPDDSAKRLSGVEGTQK